MRALAGAEGRVSAPAPLTPEGYARARRALMRRDRVLGAAIKRIGVCGMAERQQYQSLLSARISAIQQAESARQAAADAAHLKAEQEALKASADAVRDVVGVLTA